VGGAEVFFADSDIQMIADTLLKGLPVSVVSPVTSKTPCNIDDVPIDDDPDEDPGYMYAPLSRSDTRWRICQALRWFKLHKADFYAQELEAKWNDKFTEYSKLRWNGAMPASNNNPLKNLPTVDDIEAKVAALDAKYWALAKIIGQDAACDLLVSGEAGAETVAALLAGGGLEPEREPESAKSLDIPNCNPEVSPNCNPENSPNCNPEVSSNEIGEMLKRENSLIDNLEVDNLEVEEGILADAQLEGISESKDTNQKRDLGRIKEIPPEGSSIESSKVSVDSLAKATSVEKSGPKPKWLADLKEASASEPKRRSRASVDSADLGQLQSVVDDIKAKGAKSRQAQVKKVAAKQQRLDALGGAVPMELSQKKQLEQLETQWRELMTSRYPGVSIARWEGADRGKIRNLLGKYPGMIIVDALHYVVTRWDDISLRILKKKGGIPTVGFLLRFHDVLVIESQILSKCRKLEAQVAEWHKQNPYSPYPPKELHDAYQQVRRELKEIGLST